MNTDTYDNPANHYDGFNGALYYDSASAVYIIMNARIARNIRFLSPADLVPKVQISITAITDHIATFATPNPTMVSAQASVDALSANLADIEMQRAILAQLMETRDQLVAAVVQTYNEMALYVGSVAMGDPAIITLAAMDVAAPAGPAQPMTKVEGNILVGGPDDNKAKGYWTPVVGGRSYEVQTTADPLAGPWVAAGTVTEAKIELAGLTSGQKRFSRVRAINKLGPGPWSDPACAMIP